MLEYTFIETSESQNPISTVQNVPLCVTIMMYKFRDDPTVNEFRKSCLATLVGVVAIYSEIFGFFSDESTFFSTSGVDLHHHERLFSTLIELEAFVLSLGRVFSDAVISSFRHETRSTMMHHIQGEKIVVWWLFKFGGMFMAKRGRLCDSW